MLRGHPRTLIHTLHNLLIQKCDLNRIRDAQIQGTIQRFQLDDQMITAAHPVVLAPSGVAQSSGGHLRFSTSSPTAAQPIIR